MTEDGSLQASASKLVDLRIGSVQIQNLTMAESRRSITEMKSPDTRVKKTISDQP